MQFSDADVDELGAALVHLEKRQVAFLDDVAAVLHGIESILVYFDDAVPGFGTQAATQKYPADILKIAPAVFRRHCDVGQHAEFAQVLRTAQACADHIVVEGIESSEELVFARASGVQWAHLA